MAAGNVAYDQTDTENDPKYWEAQVGNPNRGVREIAIAKLARIDRQRSGLYDGGGRRVAAPSEPVAPAAPAQGEPLINTGQGVRPASMIPKNDIASPGYWDRVAKANEPAQQSAEKQLSLNADYWKRPEATGVAGKLHGNPIEIVGPNMVREHLPSGGTATYKTMAEGKPVLAGNYLLSHPNFEPHPDFTTAVNKERDRQLVAAGKLPVGPPSKPAEPLPPATFPQLVKEGLLGIQPAKSPNAPEDSGFVYNTGANIRKAVAGAGDFLSNAYQAGKNMFNGFGAGAPSVAATEPTGADTAAGVSRAQAARIQTPTAANPTPTTPTSPAKDINSTDISSAPAGTPPAAPTPTPTATPQQSPTPTPLPQDWQKRRFAYEGF